MPDDSNKGSGDDTKDNKKDDPASPSSPTSSLSPSTEIDSQETLDRFKEKLTQVLQEYAGGQDVEVEITPNNKDNLLLPHFNKPPTLPLLCLIDHPLFPEIFTPLIVASDVEKKVVDKALETNQMLALALFRTENPETDVVTPEKVYRVGVSARIMKKINLPNGSYHLLISTISRVMLEKVDVRASPIMVDVSYPEIPIVDKSNLTLRAYEANVAEKMRQITEHNQPLSQEVRLNMANIDDPGKLADFAASAILERKEDQQEILELFDVSRRLEKVLLFLTQELDLVEIQKKISQTMSSKIEKQQREFYLKEEMKAIKQELGVSDKSNEYERFQKQILALNLQDEAKETVLQELEKFSVLDPMSSEYMVTRNYLETIVNLPWEDSKPDKFSLKRAIKILDTDHYGMEDVKTRIIEYLSVRKIKKDNKGAIICLVGPPGVGKTSIGKSVAKALDRPFFRFSVGGMRDEAEIKGHRRTYVGAMPGKLIQGLKIVKTKAPVFMIDEIDKISASVLGDPFSALLEALDPAQNSSFRDHYLDLPFDLSQVLFVATANTLETLPRPLLDRFEVIELSGYIDEEKIAIAKRYLIPKVLLESGLSEQDLNFHSSALKMIAERYAREAGMRRFEKALERIARKVAYNILEKNDSLPYVVDKNNLTQYLDEPLYPKEELVKTPYPGMVMGLAWTSAGGATLIIEAVAVPSSAGGLKLTGNMGDVMKESANIAYSHVRTIASEFKISSEFFERHLIHLHIPEGATPKDGPSAGAAMASAILSLATGRQVRDSLAMTGELSLTGRVMAIGGLKEKVIAAKRNGIKLVVFPKANEKDLEKVPEHVKKGINFSPVSSFKEVVKELFKNG